MGYRVVKYFTDLQDDGFRYEVGSVYPREGSKSSKKRITELMGSKNKQGQPLIEEVEDEEEME